MMLSQPDAAFTSKDAGFTPKRQKLTEGVNSVKVSSAGKDEFSETTGRGMEGSKEDEGAPATADTKPRTSCRPPRLEKERTIREWEGLASIPQKDRKSAALRPKKNHEPVIPDCKGKTNVGMVDHPSKHIRSPPPVDPELLRMFPTVHPRCEDRYLDDLYALDKGSLEHDSVHTSVTTKHKGRGERISESTATSVAITSSNKGMEREWEQISYQQRRVISPAGLQMLEIRRNYEQCLVKQQAPIKTKVDGADEEEEAIARVFLAGSDDSGNRSSNDGELDFDSELSDLMKDATIAETEVE
jgi:hypothetical protein